MLHIVLGFSCAIATNPSLEDPISMGDLSSSETQEDSAAQADAEEPIAESDDTETTLDLDGQQGALVTSDCTYESYAYAIDILLSCGNERFGDELRLHTFKRHSHSHKEVFNDQRITYREQQLWFDSYSTPRCIWTDSQGRFYLSSQQDDCDRFNFIPEGAEYLIQEVSGGKCATLGGVECASHEWTGGNECGGIDHRYLPLRLGDCSDGLRFSFAAEADDCSGEYPESYCF